MPNVSEGPITVFDNSVSSLNLALTQILERLDSIKGLRGDPTVYAGVTVGAPENQQQAARLADIPTENPASVLFWMLGQQETIYFPGTAPAALTDNTGGAATSTLAAVGGITALTDNSGGTANDTVEALPDPADAPPDADTLRDDLVANLLPALRNDIADLAAKVNALIADMNDVRDALASLASFDNTVLAAILATGIAV